MSCEALCVCGCMGRVEIVNWDGQVLRSFGLHECEGSPHDARIVRRNSLLAALRTAVPDSITHYGVNIANMHATDDGVRCQTLCPFPRCSLTARVARLRVAGA
jgi:hypothetical protein